MDEISAELGVDLHTESLLVRAEQLSRLESDKLVDKVGGIRTFTLIFIIYYPYNLKQHNTLQFYTVNIVQAYYL